MPKADAHSLDLYASSGLIAGIVWIAAVYALAPFFSTQTGAFSRLTGGLLVPPAADGVATAFGLAILLGISVGWALVYRFVRPRLPGRGWVNGAVYGALIWLVGAVLLLPWMYALVNAAGGTASLPAPGRFGIGFGGLSSALLALTAHIIYGSVLAALIARREALS